jgi:hypothetical protein
MILQRIISLVLLLTLMLQMLPVKQVGAVLFSNQINEEIPHDSDAFKDNSKKPALSSDYLVVAHLQGNPGFFNDSRRYISYSSDIPSNYSLEVPVPPPNMLSL